MADTRTQAQVEDWVRKDWMPRKFGQQFRRERLRLACGGVFDFDAHGYPEDVWSRAKEEAKAVLVGVARVRQVIAYSDLAANMKSISFLPTDQRFFFLLREISAEEYRAGRGMLTAVAAIASRGQGSSTSLAASVSM